MYEVYKFLHIVETLLDTDTTRTPLRNCAIEYLTTKKSEILSLILVLETWI